MLLLLYDVSQDNRKWVCLLHAYGRGGFAVRLSSKTRFHNFSCFDEPSRVGGFYRNQPDYRWDLEQGCSVSTVGVSPTSHVCDGRGRISPP